MSYKKGDKVVVKYKDSDYWDWVPPMDELVGKVGVVEYSSGEEFDTGGHRVLAVFGLYGRWNINSRCFGTPEPQLMD